MAFTAGSHSSERYSRTVILLGAMYVWVCILPSSVVRAASASFLVRNPVSSRWRRSVRSRSSPPHRVQLSNGRRSTQCRLLQRVQRWVFWLPSSMT